MAHITVNMNLKTRPAIYTPPVDRPNLGVKAHEKYDVDVFGVYQVAIDEDVDAYFVVMLPSGKCTYAGIEQIQFTDCGVPEEAEPNE